VKTHTRETAEADIVYDVQGPLPTADGSPPLLMIGQPAESRQDVIDQRLRAMRAVGSPAYAFDESAVRDVAGRADDRSHDRLGTAHQPLASVASGDRTTLLQSVDVLTNAAAALKERNGSQADDASDQRRSDSSPTL
jgi:hypothetical protein